MEYTLVIECPRSNSLLILKKVLLVILEWQYSCGLEGSRIGIKERVSVASIAAGTIPSCKITGVGQGQDAKVLKKLEIRVFRLVFGCI